jgi:ABC-type sulfate/molybdate transport systems ATPase subunit
MAFLTVSGIRLEEDGSVALNDVSFTQKPFQKLALAGESGAGKSTLLQIIAGFIQPAAGEVVFQGKKVIGPADKLVPGHKGIAYLSQHYELPPYLRVEQVLRYANTLSQAEAQLLYEVCRIDHLANRKTDHLSGGERQRIALARLLTSSPRLLLLDEPFSNLNLTHKHILKSVIHDLGEKLRITCLLVSHDPLDTLSWADEILVLKQGQLVQQGPPEVIYRQPVDAYTAGLFGDYSLLSAAGAAAFGGFPGGEGNGKSLLVRPESITLGKDEQRGVPGEVRQVRYYGSHYAVEVLVAGEVMTVKTGEGGWEQGEAVNVSLVGEGWYV